MQRTIELFIVYNWNNWNKNMWSEVYSNTFPTLKLEDRQLHPQQEAQMGLIYTWGPSANVQSV